MITVLRIPVSKDKLRLMPKEERTLLLALGYAANQISLLTKLLIFSSNKTPVGQPEQSLSGAQTQMLARFLVGILHETWGMITKRFLGNPVGKELQSKLDAGGQSALARLKKTFGGSNILAKLRNDFIFHPPSNDDIDAAFVRAASDPAWDGDWNWFFSHSNFNSFYFVSDVVVLHGILNAAGETDLVSAQQKIMSELSLTSQDITQFIMALTAALWVRRFGSEMDGEVVAKIDDAPDAMDVWIPFFVEIPAETPVEGKQGSEVNHA